MAAGCGDGGAAHLAEPAAAGARLGDSGQRAGRPATECAFAIASSAGLALTPGTIAGIADQASDTAALLGKRHRATTQTLVEQVRIHHGRIEIDCRTAAIAALLGAKPAPDAPPTLTLTSEVTLTRSGRAMRLVQGDGTAVKPA